MNCTRLYSDERGESHFEDIEIDLALTEYAPPAPPLSLSSSIGATQFGFMNAPAGWSSDWHPASARNFFCVLTGEWEDTSGKGHSSRVVSETDSLAAMVQLAVMPATDEHGWTQI
jgi:hypothetical protein